GGAMSVDWVEIPDGEAVSGM
ncbi:unnamed protein product, partial [Didymodactylos carnosus]